MTAAGAIWTNTLHNITPNRYESATTERHKIFFYKVIIMPKIHILDKALAELIAAGEVVERPASIAKELIENAIDAGASAVTVEIEGGGVALLRVGDNGCGIAREEIPTAFLRHATSKIGSAGDLEAILTLGFRGEALASISAMCRVELLSKTAGEEEGTLCRAEGGVVLDAFPAACPTGTIVTVRDVFYNTPARMKFLKKDVGEANAVAQVVDKCALSHPGIAFRFIRDGKTRLQTSGGGDLKAAIAAVYGRDFAACLIPARHEMPEDGIALSGYITSPEGARPSRAYQNFFLNARYVRTKTAAAALEEACKTFTGSGKYPGCVLHIDIAPGLVDVNVHPAKTEVRFANEKPVFHCVYFAVKNALAAHNNAGFPPGVAGGRGFTQGAAGALEQPPPPEQIKINQAKGGYISRQNPPSRMTSEDFRVLFAPAQNNDCADAGLFRKSVSLHSGAPDIDIHVNNAIIAPKTNTITRAEPPLPEEEPVAGENTPPPRVIGELAGTYILLEEDGGLVLVDKHAAHERILYEKLKETIARGSRQVLLAPITLTLAREEYSALLENFDKVEEAGFLAEDFGGGSVIVREVPLELGEKDIAFILGEIAAKLRAGNFDHTPDAMDRIYYSIACKGAVRAGDKNSLPELEAIAEKLERNPEITRCPHGRPVRASITAREIAKMFGRS